MPFADNNTARYWVTYTSAGKQHDLLFRGTETATIGTMNGPVSSICTAMRPLMRTLDGFLSARFAAKGSNFSTPVAWTPIFGTGSNTGGDGDPESFFLDFVGRDYTFGAHARWSLFTASADAPRPATNRVNGADNAKVQAVITALTTQANNPTTASRICTISQGQPVIYPYANTGFNAYWQRQQRTQ